MKFHQPKKIIHLFILLWVFGCIGEDVIDDFVEPEVRILNSTPHIDIDKQHTYEAKFFNNIGIEENIQILWKSSDTNIISIDENGTATGVTGGIATITASVESSSGVVTTEEIVEVPHVDPMVRILNPIEEIEIGKTHSYEAKFFDNNTREQNIEILWQSSNDTIISIDTTGTATGLTGGMAIITALVQFNGEVITGEESVEVPFLEPQVRILNPIEEIAIGDQHIYQATYFNNNGQEEEVPILWESSDSSIVEIDENGSATGRRGGTATIIASVELSGGVVNGEEPVIVPNVEPKIRILNPIEEIAIGDQHTYQATYFNNNGLEEEVPIQWESSDSSIVEIDENGTATGLKGGTATIIASVELSSGVVKGEETVIVPNVEPKIRILNPIEEIAIGDQHTYQATYFNNNGLEEEVQIVWESSDSTIIAIDQNGTATALMGGTATITASVELSSGVVKEEGTVIVPNVEPQVIIQNPIVELKVGNAHDYEAKFFNNNGLEEEVPIQWESSDKTIISINTNGVATALSEGTAIISASVESNGGIVTADNTVAVTQDFVDPEVRIINPIEEIEVTNTHLYEAIFFNNLGLPENVTIMWQSSDSNVFSINENGLATALTAGTATITASVNTGNEIIRVENTVTVTPNFVDPIINIINPIVEIEVNNTHNYQAVYFNNLGQQETVTIIWESSNETIISIDVNGVATALSEGTATIRASVNTGNEIISVENTVIVTPNFVDPITNIVNPIVEIEVNNTHNYQAVYFNNLGQQETVTIIWESSDETIISIDANGVATALSEGVATISASADTGAGIIRDENTVTVTPNFVDPIINIVNPLTEIEISETHNYQVAYFNNLGEQENIQIQWESSNETIISIDQNGLATALSEGTSTITASADTGAGIISDENTVTVTPNFVDPEVRVLNPITELEVNDSHTFEAIFFNNLGEQENIQIQWESSNETVISIDQNGFALAISEGSATISAFVQYNNDEVRTNVSVNIIPEPESIVKQGTIVTTSQYLLEGRFTISENNNGGIFLDISEDYRADTDLPGLYLYLTNNPNSTNGALEVGPVEVFSGAHDYTIPNTGINDYSYLLYWCKPFVVKVGDGLIED